MTVKVKTLTGREIEIDIEPTDTVERIKERVEEKEGIPPIQQRLIFAGETPSQSSAVHIVTANLDVCRLHVSAWHCTPGRLYVVAVPSDRPPEFSAMQTDPWEELP